MPITPDEAARGLDARHEADLKELYEHIDSDLVSRWHTGLESVTMAIPKVHNKVRKTAIAVYQQLGWDVTFRHEQRDGPYLTFKRKPTPSRADSGK